MVEYTLMIRSQPFIYVPEFFAWIETAYRTGTDIDDFLDGLGIPNHLWDKVKLGKYQKSTEGNDLVLTFEVN